MKQAEKHFGAEHPRTFGLQAQLGLNLLQQKKYAAAEKLLRTCLQGRARQEPNAWTTFNTQSLLGGALLGQKKYADAEPLLLKGYQGMKERQASIPPVGQPRLKEALERLVQLYEVTGNSKEEARWRRELDAHRTPEKKEKERP